jgi:four helix bundle protein
MTLLFEDLRVLKDAEKLADEVWRVVTAWDPFAGDVVGKQLARAADSVGANIAEAYGRYHFGEKLQFLYYARGSLFETKYWLNRAVHRDLIGPDDHTAYGQSLNNLGRQINQFAQALRQQRSGGNRLAESSPSYTVPSEPVQDTDYPILTIQDLNALTHA